MMTVPRLSKKDREELELDAGGNLKVYLDPWVQDVLNEHPDWTPLQIARQARILFKRSVADARWKAEKAAHEKAQEATSVPDVQGLVRGAEDDAIAQFAAFVATRMMDPETLLNYWHSRASIHEALDGLVDEYRNFDDWRATVSR